MSDEELPSAVLRKFLKTSMLGSDFNRQIERLADSMDLLVRCHEVRLQSGYPIRMSDMAVWQAGGPYNPANAPGTKYVMQKFDTN